MPLIFETDDFTVVAHDQPHHSRENGGHIVITPKAKFQHRHEMPPELTTKLAHLTNAVGEAFMTVMKERGLNVARINYQDNGNWAYKEPQKTPQVHVHLYLRTWGEKHPRNDPRFQPFPDALVFPDRETGYYEGFESLSEKECLAVRNKCIKEV